MISNVRPQQNSNPLVLRRRSANYPGRGKRIHGIVFDHPSMPRIMAVSSIPPQVIQNGPNSSQHIETNKPSFGSSPPDLIYSPPGRTSMTASLCNPSRDTSILRHKECAGNSTQTDPSCCHVTRTSNLPPYRRHSTSCINTRTEGFNETSMIELSRPSKHLEKSKIRFPPSYDRRQHGLPVATDNSNHRSTFERHQEISPGCSLEGLHGVSHKVNQQADYRLHHNHMSHPVNAAKPPTSCPIDKRQQARFEQHQTMCMCPGNPAKRTVSCPSHVPCHAQFERQQPVAPVRNPAKRTMSYPNDILQQQQDVVCHGNPAKRRVSCPSDLRQHTQIQQHQVIGSPGNTTKGTRTGPNAPNQRVQITQHERALANAQQGPRSTTNGMTSHSHLNQHKPATSLNSPSIWHGQTNAPDGINARFYVNQHQVSDASGARGTYTAHTVAPSSTSCAQFFPTSQAGHRNYTPPNTTTRYHLSQHANMRINSTGSLRGHPEAYRYTDYSTKFTGTFNIRSSQEFSGQYHHELWRRTCEVGTNKSGRYWDNQHKTTGSDHAVFTSPPFVKPPAVRQNRASDPTRIGTSHESNRYVSAEQRSCFARSPDTSPQSTQCAVSPPCHPRSQVMSTVGPRGDRPEHEHAKSCDNLNVEDLNPKEKESKTVVISDSDDDDINYGSSHSSPFFDWEESECDVFSPVQGIDSECEECTIVHKPEEIDRYALVGRPTSPRAKLKTNDIIAFEGSSVVTKDHLDEWRHERTTEIDTASCERIRRQNGCESLRTGNRSVIPQSDIPSYPAEKQRQVLKSATEEKTNVGFRYNEHEILVVNDRERRSKNTGRHGAESEPCVRISEKAATTYERRTNKDGKRSWLEYGKHPSIRDENGVIVVEDLKISEDDSVSSSRMGSSSPVFELGFLTHQLSKLTSDQRKSEIQKEKHIVCASETGSKADRRESDNFKSACECCEEKTHAIGMIREKLLHCAKKEKLNFEPFHCPRCNCPGTTEKRSDAPPPKSGKKPTGIVVGIKKDGRMNVVLARKTTDADDLLKDSSGKTSCGEVDESLGNSEKESNKSEKGVGLLQFNVIEKDVGLSWRNEDKPAKYKSDTPGITSQQWEAYSVKLEKGKTKKQCKREMLNELPERVRQKIETKKQESEIRPTERTAFQKWREVQDREVAKISNNTTSHHISDSAEHRCIPEVTEKNSGLSQVKKACDDVCRKRAYPSLDIPENLSEIENGRKTYSSDSVKRQKKSQEEHEQEKYTLKAMRNYCDFYFRNNTETQEDVEKKAFTNKQLTQQLEALNIANNTEVSTQPEIQNTVHDDSSVRKPVMESSDTGKCQENRQKPVVIKSSEKTLTSSEWKGILMGRIEQVRESIEMEQTPWKTKNKRKVLEKLQQQLKWWEGCSPEEDAAFLSRKLQFFQTVRTQYELMKTIDVQRRTTKNAVNKEIHNSLLPDGNSMLEVSGVYVSKEKKTKEKRTKEKKPRTKTMKPLSSVNKERLPKKKVVN